MSTVIKVEHIFKYYRLGLIGGATLSDDLNRWIAKLLGKPDPLSIVGDHNNESNENNQIWALHDISIDVKEGEILGVIGRNGAGKSTLLKILSRITAPTKGKIKIKGRVGSLLEVGTGFHPELTGRENIYLNGAILGMTRKEISLKLNEIIEFAEMEKFIDTPAKRYSSGMTVRLAFAVAAHLEPEILVIDEVLAVGDAGFQKKCLGKMGDIAKEGRTVLFVSHNLVAVNQLCSRSILIDKGKIIQSGPSSEVVNYYSRLINESCVASMEYDHPMTEGIAALRRISIDNIKGDISTNIDMSEEFNISIDYEIGKEIQGLCVGLTIFSVESNQPLLSFSDPELEYSRLEKREPGYYKSEITIPARLLNSGTYRLRVGITKQAVILDVSEDITFTISDSVGIIQHLGYERKNSLLSLQLPWQVKKIVGNNCINGH